MERVTWNKYHAQKTTRNGKTFHSKHEADRYAELLLLERAGKISGLKTQVSYIVIPAQYENGKCVEKSCRYVADFVYWQDCQLVVEDAKGFKTDAYKIKKKLMRQVYGIKIKEV